LAVLDTLANHNVIYEDLAPMVFKRVKMQHSETRMMNLELGFNRLQGFSKAGSEKPKSDGHEEKRTNLISSCKNCSAIRLHNLHVIYSFLIKKLPTNYKLKSFLLAIRSHVLKELDGFLI
jgi:hypothetical protein